MEKILLTGGKLLEHIEGLVMAQKYILLDDGRIAAIDLNRAKLSTLSPSPTYPGSSPWIKMTRTSTGRMN